MQWGFIWMSLFWASVFSWMMSSRGFSWVYAVLVFLSGVTCGLWIIRILEGGGMT